MVGITEVPKGLIFFIFAIISYIFTLIIKSILNKNGYEVFLVPKHGRLDIDFIKMIDLIKKEKDYRKKKKYIILLIVQWLLISVLIFFIAKYWFS